MAATSTSSPPKPGIGQRLREEGAGEVARSYLSDRYAGAVRRLAHRFVAPRISESYRRAGAQSTDPAAILRALGEADAWARIEPEFRAVSDALRARYRPDLPYPTISAVSGPESALLYALVRLRRPARVVETGVANGHSSFLVLRALQENGSGHLTSIDVRPDVGGLVPEELRANWQLRILDRRHARRDLDAAMAAEPSIDLFLHDSDHSYRWQTLEYSLAWARLSAHGILASDDIDWSYAFLDFSDQVHRRPVVLVSESKSFGAIPRAGA